MKIRLFALSLVAMATLPRLSAQVLWQTNNIDDFNPTTNTYTDGRWSYAWLNGNILSMTTPSVPFQLMTGHYPPAVSPLDNWAVDGGYAQNTRYLTSAGAMRTDGVAISYVYEAPDNYVGNVEIAGSYNPGGVPKSFAIYVVDRDKFLNNTDGYRAGLTYLDQQRGIMAAGSFDFNTTVAANDMIIFAMNSSDANYGVPFNLDLTISGVSVPEPSSWLLLCASVGAFLIWMRRRRTGPAAV